MRRRSCPSGRARFPSHRAALAVVGTRLVEPANPGREVIPTDVESRRCGMCSGVHVRVPWNPWARRGSPAARERQDHDFRPWPVTVPAPQTPTAGRAPPSVRRPSGPARPG